MAQTDSAVAVSSAVGSGVVARSERFAVEGYIPRAWATGDYELWRECCPVMSEGYGRRLGEYLDEVYGGVPRRISCSWAMWRAVCVPMLPSWDVNAPVSPVQVGVLCDRGLRHHRESGDTLRAAAWQIAPRTWISSGPRSVIDEMLYSCGHRPEFVLMALVCSKFDVEELIAISRGIGGDDAMRRLASISCLASELGSLRPWHEELQEYARTLDGDLLRIWESGLPLSSEHEVDETFNVVWNIAKRETVYAVKQ